MEKALLAKNIEEIKIMRVFKLFFDISSLKNKSRQHDLQVEFRRIACTSHRNI